MLNGSELGTTLFFDRTNWFIPQQVTVTAHQDASGQDDDFLAQGRRSAIIQHVVVEGVSADDQGEYDNLAILSVVADVIRMGLTLERPAASQAHPARPRDVDVGQETPTHHQRCGVTRREP